jgi:hypothetical protein
LLEQAGLSGEVEITVEDGTPRHQAGAEAREGWAEAFRNGRPR